VQTLTNFSEEMIQVAAALEIARTEFPLPPRLWQLTEEFADQVLSLLFPHFELDVKTELPISSFSDRLGGMADLLDNIASSLKGPAVVAPNQYGLLFAESLPGIQRQLLLDAEAIRDGDPAATSLDEVILTYPGFLAIALYRVAHELHGLGLPLIPKLISAIAHRRTAIDIHPAAKIGRRFCIDHGTGVVIGETAIVGNGVKLYQGVTLGALSVQKGLAQVKRHPTLEDNVVIYANATILGGSTVVGHDTIVGGNAFVTESLPPYSFAGRNAEVRPRRSGDSEEIEFYI